MIGQLGKGVVSFTWKYPIDIIPFDWSIPSRVIAIEFI